VFAHYHHDVIDVDRMRIDPAKLDTIARLGGNTCSTIRDRFEMPTPTLAEFDASRAGSSDEGKSGRDAES
jgi:hypothetical protein